MNVTRKDATITNTDDTFPGSFEVILSAPTKDRDGDTLLPEEWKQPLPDHITFDSDHGMSVATTVGSGVPRIDEESGNLVVSGTYSSLPRAQEVRTLVNEGHIRTTSVAFMTEKEDVKDASGKTVKTTSQRELLNGAFVAIPSNREALVLSSKGIPSPADVFGKAGARNSKSDAEHIQAIHDHALALGATPADTTGAALESMGGKSVTFATFKDVQRLIALAREQFPDEPSLKAIDLPEADDEPADDDAVIGETVDEDPAEVTTPEPDADQEPDAPEAPAAEKDAPSDEIELKYRALRIGLAAAGLIDE